MPRGGARPGAGRPRKPLAEKIATGNPSRHPLKKVDFGPGDVNIKAPEYLDCMVTKLPPEANIMTPREIFEKTVEFLRPCGVLRLISDELIAEYTMAKYFLLVAQWELSETAITAKNKETKEVFVTSFTEAMLKMQKNCAMTWSTIWNIVQKNAEQIITDPEDDLMLEVIAMRMRAKIPEPGGN